MAVLRSKKTYGELRSSNESHERRKRTDCEQIQREKSVNTIRRKLQRNERERERLTEELDELEQEHRNFGWMRKLAKMSKSQRREPASEVPRSTTRRRGSPSPETRERSAGGLYGADSTSVQNGERVKQAEKLRALRRSARLKHAITTSPATEESLGRSSAGGPSNTYDDVPGETSANAADFNTESRPRRMKCGPRLAPEVEIPFSVEQRRVGATRPRNEECTHETNTSKPISLRHAGSLREAGDDRKSGRMTPVVEIPRPTHRGSNMLANEHQHVPNMKEFVDTQKREKRRAKARAAYIKSLLHMRLPRNQKIKADVIRLLPPDVAYNLCRSSTRDIDGCWVSTLTRNEAGYTRKGIQHVQRHLNLPGTIWRSPYLHQLAVIARGTTDRELLTRTLGGTRYQVSHLCHNNACANPAHVAVESRDLNKARNACHGRQIIDGPHMRHYPCPHGDLEGCYPCVLPELSVADI